MTRAHVAAFILTAAASGFAGGLAVRLLSAPPVFAQEPMHPKVLSAESFTLVNAAGEVRGIIGFAPDGSARFRLSDGNGSPWIEAGISRNAKGRMAEPGPEIRLLGPDGKRVLWSAPSEIQMLPAGKVF